MTRRVMISVAYSDHLKVSSESSFVISCYIETMISKKTKAITITKQTPVNLNVDFNFTPFGSKVVFQ
ncbi:hypothetical protein BH18THE2_BH18THE2_09850 [soil metagenome]